MTIAETISEKVRALKPEQQEQVLAFIERLARRPPASSPADPYGSAAGLVEDLTFEVFRENRKTMWGSATDRELDHDGT
jgi:hypothetical protein